MPGMHESSAHARAANIVFIPRDTLIEAGAVVETALWALHFTPQVSLLSNGLLLDVSASLRLFGGHDALVEQLRNGVHELGLTPQLGSAPTAAAAWLFAQHEDALYGDNESFTALLEQLPVALLVSAQPHLDTLESIGCQSIGQLRRLPRQGITRRFGKEMLAELDRAFGAEPEVHAWYEPPASFSARLELPSRVDTTEALLFAARRLLMQMTGWLVARHAAVSRFSLLLHHETVRNGKSPTTTVLIALGSPSRDLAHLTLLLQEHLAKVALTNSVIELSLQADDIEPLAAPNTELFPTAASQAESMARLIERLESRLGEEAIVRLKVVGDHRPERCSVAIPVHRTLTVRKGQMDMFDAFPVRPAWLLREPVPLMVRGHKPFYQSTLQILAGPERIEAGWWDDALAVRDYFVACNDANLLLWVYRERQGVEVDEPGWFLQGFF
ncbi:MAG: putative polymerase [Burkholderia sp.]|nr:putative polymerase [Burkholderia sp.]